MSPKRSEFSLCSITGGNEEWSVFANQITLLCFHHLVAHFIPSQTISHAHWRSNNPANAFPKLYWMNFIIRCILETWEFFLILLKKNMNLFALCLVIGRCKSTRLYSTSSWTQLHWSTMSLHTITNLKSKVFDWSWTESGDTVTLLQWPLGPTLIHLMFSTWHCKLNPCFSKDSPPAIMAV